MAETPDLINKSVVKATVILSELGRHPAGVTATELAQLVRMSRPTAFRLLLSLEQAGFVERDDNRYRLGWKIARLGRLADPNKGIVAIVQPVLDALAEELNETIGYAVIHEGADFDLIAEAYGSRLITLSQGYVGKDFPIHASATGKLVLSHLSDAEVEALLPRRLPKVASRTIVKREDLIAALHDIRVQGYSVVDDELEESLLAMAVPVRDAHGRFIGALAVTGPTERMKRSSLDDIVERLRRTAGEIATLLGASDKSAATPARK